MTRFDFGRTGQVDHGLGQVELGLGQPDELDRPGGGVGHHQAHRVGLPDVLAGQDHQAPGDEPGVLTGLEHPGQPVEAGVGVRTPHRLDEGADLVVVLVLAVVVQPRVAGPAPRRSIETGRPPARATATSRVVSTARASPSASPTSAADGVGLGRRPLGGQPAGHHLLELLGRQRLEPPEGRPRQQRGVDLEEGVLGGGPDEHHQPLLDRGQQGVLLGAVEPVHLVEEQDGPPALLAEEAPGAVDDLPHVLHPGAHRRQGDEPLGGGARRSPRPGWSCRYRADPRGWPRSAGRTR